MKKLWERLKNAAAALAGRTSAPAPAGGVKKPKARIAEWESTRSGVLASLARFATKQGSGNAKGISTSPVKQNAWQGASTAKFTVRQNENAPHTKQVSPKKDTEKSAITAKFATKQKQSEPRTKQVAAKPKNSAAPQLKSTPPASNTPPKLKLLAYPATTLESAVTTVKQNPLGLDATLVNEILSLQYRRCASSIDEQEVL